MKITMDMSSYEIEQEENEFEGYGEEIMNAGWNPAIDLVCGLQEIQAPADPAPSVIAEIVYRKMYSYKE